MKLSAAALNNDSLPEGRTHDHIVSGLFIYKGKKRRTWYVRYRGAGGKQETDLIGYFIPNAPPDSDSMGLLDARNKAKEILGRVEAGVPMAEDKPAHPKQGGMTLETLLDEYERARRAKAVAAGAGGNKKKMQGMKTLNEAVRTVRRNLADYLKLPVRDFKKADLKKVRDEIAARAPQMSDRFMAYGSAIMEWAAKEDLIEHNFWRETLRVGPGLVKRERVLTQDEMRAIWTACARMESAEGRAYGRLIRFLLTSAQRISEGAALRHGAIIGGRWKQGEEDNKSGREHLLKLPQLALDQLGSGKADQFCFPGKKGKLGGFSKFKKDLDKLSGVTGWRHHDLRRTASTNMQELGVEPHIVNAVLNHAIGGVGGHYLHAKMIEAKGEALQTWAAELAKIILNPEIGKQRPV